MIRTFGYLSESKDFDAFCTVEYEISTIITSHDEPETGGIISHFAVLNEDGEEITTDFGLKELNTIEKLCYEDFAEHDNRNENLEDFYQEQFERRREEDGMYQQY